MEIDYRTYRRIQGPLSILSIATCVFGAMLGYVLIMLGITLYFDMGGFDTNAGTNVVTTVDSAIVAGVGVALCVVAYLGWRGFMRFSY